MFATHILSDSDILIAGTCASPLIAKLIRITAVCVKQYIIWLMLVSQPGKTIWCYTQLAGKLNTVDTAPTIVCSLLEYVSSCEAPLCQCWFAIVLH